MPDAKSAFSTQRDRVAAAGGVERDARARDAAADDDDVELLASEGGQGGGAGQHVVPILASSPPVPVPVVFAGPTAQHQPLRIEVRARRVVRVVVTVRRYACGVFGDLGPLRVVRRVSARVAADGTFRLTAGPPSERLTVRAVAGRRSASGRVRVRGTIATGEPCRSGWVRFRVPRAAARR